jgi:hypothetical protein
MSERPAEVPQPEPLKPEESRANKLWVPIILVIAVLLGLVLAETVPSPPVCPPGYYCYPYYQFLLGVQRALMLHVVLSTIEVVLLVSLVAVYVKVYAETRANFSLGLIVVLGALLVHSILSYPLVVYNAFNDAEPVLFSSILFPYTDLLTIVAFSVFLYLSLE